MKQLTDFLDTSRLMIRARRLHGIVDWCGGRDCDVTAAVLPRDIQYKYFHSDLHNGQFIALLQVWHVPSGNYSQKIGFPAC